MSGIFWAGRARHPGPPSQPHHVSLEFHNVGGWFTYGDLALGAGVDFLAVAEHRLIPARVRSEWSRLWGKGLSSMWAPASQVYSHVGNAGVGVVSFRGAPLALPTFATAQFKSFFDCVRAVRCMLPLAAGRLKHLCVLHGYAALGELGVVAREQPRLVVGDFNVEPTKIPCLAKGISAGLWFDFEEAWALAAGLQPALACKRNWTAAGGHRRDFVLGCPIAAAATLNELLFGERGGSKTHCFGELWDPGALQMEGRVPSVMKTRAGLATVTFLSWLANARMSSVIVRIPVRISNGSTLRSVGSSDMSSPVHCLGQGRHVVCQRVRVVFRSCNGVGGEWCFLGFLVSPWCLVHVGGASSASLPLCVYRAWVTKVCLLLDTPFLRRSVGAFSLGPLGSLLGSKKYCQSNMWENFVIFLFYAVYASCSGTAQSPWS